MIANRTRSTTRAASLVLALALALVAAPAAALTAPAAPAASDPAASTTTSTPATSTTADSGTADSSSLIASSEAALAAAAPITPDAVNGATPEPVATTDAVAEVPATAFPSITISQEVPELALVGVTWAEFEAPAGLKVALRSQAAPATSQNPTTQTPTTWSEWQQLEITGNAPQPEDAPLPEASRGGTEPLVVAGATKIEIRLTAPAGSTLPTDTEIHVIDPGTSAADEQAIPDPTDSYAAKTSGSGSEVTASAIPNQGQPEILSRATWGADESIRTWPPRIGQVTGVVVHHTAGSNDYTADQVPAIIRGIYSYHANTRGWGDIGYNFLIDKFGRVWEGRYGGITNAVVGGHAAPANSTYFGLSIMGDFTNQEPPQVALNAAAQLTAWKFSVHGISMDGFSTGPNGEQLSRVIAHREVPGASTACPGNTFYNGTFKQIGDLVTQVQPSMPSYSQSDVTYVRLAGADRYSTATTLSAWVYGTKPSVTYIATGDNFADALAASSAAGVAGAPILLVSRDSIPASVITELKRHRPQTIRVLGGPSVISNDVLNQLNQYVVPIDGNPATPATRIQGADRYETASLISQAAWPTGATTVYLASGENYADALSAGSAAARQTAPLLLSKAGELPAATAAELSRLNPSQIVIAGGTGTISDATLAAAQAAVPNAAVTRLGGADRYATSALLVQGAFSGGATSVFYATGANWPDALGAGPSAAKFGSPVLLMKPNCVPVAVRQAIGTLNPSLIYITGGQGAIQSGAVGATC